MSRIKIKKLTKNKTGIELLEDEESFMNELEEEEIKIIRGGDIITAVGTSTNISPVFSCRFDTNCTIPDNTIEVPTSK